MCVQEFGVLVQLATIQIVSCCGGSFLEIAGLVTATFSLTLEKRFLLTEARGGNVPSVPGFWCEFEELKSPFLCRTEAHPSKESQT